MLHLNLGAITSWLCTQVRFHKVETMVYLSQNMVVMLNQNTRTTVPPPLTHHRAVPGNFILVSPSSPDPLDFEDSWLNRCASRGSALLDSYQLKPQAVHQRMEHREAFILSHFLVEKTLKFTVPGKALALRGNEVNAFYLPNTMSHIHKRDIVEKSIEYLLVLPMPMGSLLQNYRTTDLLTCHLALMVISGFITKDPFNLASADRSKDFLQRKVQTSASQKTPVRYEMSGSRDTMTISLDLGHWTRLSAIALPVPFLHPHLFT
ncbi:Ephrin Type-A Receptor 2 [Manis pentadactyla]|nr:Ephrin Type-A Receptor 2 [Manis pentadactyla]